MWTRGDKDRRQRTDRLSAVLTVIVIYHSFQSLLGYIVIPFFRSYKRIDIVALILYIISSIARLKLQTLGWCPERFAINKQCLSVRWTTVRQKYRKSGLQYL